MESGSSGSSASVERQTEDVPTIAPLTVLEAPVSKVTPDELTVDLGNLGDGLVGIISRNDVALNAADRSTAGFKAGDMVRAIAISGRDGVVKLSIRKLKQQQRDEETASAEKAEAEAKAALRRQEEQRRQEEKRRRDMEAAATAAAARRKEEEKRRRAEKMARLKRRGMVAALGIAATLALVLLVARWHRPATAAMLNQKDKFVSHMRSLGAGGGLKVRQGKGKGAQSYTTFPQEELINSLPKFADLSDEQFVYPKQAPSVTDPDFFKPVMVFTTSGADSAEYEQQVVNMAIQRGLIAVRVESAKYALYAPDDHPGYREPPAK
jgi:predicted RNA-binding protein with RPS1 domain